MIVAGMADLDELNPAAELIQHRLITARLPPLDCHIVFPACSYYPEGRVLSCELVHLRVPGLFLLGKVYVSLKCCGSDSQAQTPVQELDEPMKAVVGDFIALIYEGIGALNLLH